MDAQRGNPWRTLDSRVVYRNPWIVVREDKVIRPDGNDGIYGVVEMVPCCGTLAVSDDDQVALVNQWRYVHGRMSLEIPAGGSEPGETLLETATRELAEETGLAAGNWTSLGSIDTNNGSTIGISHMFLARNLSPTAQNLQGDEQVELVWMPFADALGLAMSGEITDAVSVAAILKAELLRRRGG